MDRSLRRELKSTFGMITIGLTRLTIWIVEVRIRSKIKIIIFSKRKNSNPSVRLFVLWITLPSILLYLAIL